MRPREVYVNIPNHSFELSRVLPLSISMYNSPYRGNNTNGGNSLRSKSVSDMTIRECILCGLVYLAPTPAARNLIKS